MTKADHILEKIAKKKKRKSKASWKNTAVVAGTGAASTFVPFVPMHVGSAIERAPKGYKGKAAKETYKWGHIASLPSTLLLAGHALKGGGPVRKLVTFAKNPKIKNWQNFSGSFKRLGKPFKDYVLYGPIAQGLGAGYGYRKGLTPATPGRKRKKKRRKSKK